jgi:hypothetical protein
MKKVRFVLSPTGHFGLGYNIGEEAEFEDKQAKELIEMGFAVPVDGDAKPTKEELKKAADLTVNGAENASDKAAAGAEKRDGVKP